MASNEPSQLMAPVLADGTRALMAPVLADGRRALMAPVLSMGSVLLEGVLINCFGCLLVGSEKIYNFAAELNNSQLKCYNVLFQHTFQDSLWR